MFNATELRKRAGQKTRLDSYFKRRGFTAIVNGLVSDGVPENEIMVTATGPGGCTMLHNLFFIDFMVWIGGTPYYRSVKKFVSYPESKNERAQNTRNAAAQDRRTGTHGL